MKPKTPAITDASPTMRQIRDQNAAKIVAALRAGARLDPGALADIIESYALDLQERDDMIDKIRNWLASLGVKDRVTLVTDYLKPAADR